MVPLMGKKKPMVMLITEKEKDFESDYMNTFKEAAESNNMRIGYFYGHMENITANFTKFA